MNNVDTCLGCGAYVPEGRQICWKCEKGAMTMSKEPKSMIDEMCYKNLKLGTCPSCGSTITSCIDNCLPFFYCLKCGEYLQVGDTKECDRQ